MGGPGSGLWSRSNRKPTVENYRSIDIRRWHRSRLLVPGCYFYVSWSGARDWLDNLNVSVRQDRLVLDYHYRSGPSVRVKMEQVVLLAYTACHFGGQRPWFICPGCGIRVAVLYAAGRHFLCHHCYKLSYASQRETYMDRMYRKARKIRRRLGADMNFNWPIFRKPKGMHHKTFDRLCLMADEAEHEAEHELMLRMARHIDHPWKRAPIR